MYPVVEDYDLGCHTEVPERDVFYRLSAVYPQNKYKDYRERLQWSHEWF